MYQSEAMWIKFDSENFRKYLIKVYVGGINVVSGEPAVEDASSQLRRQSTNQKALRHSLQDYIVVPGQLWLDGIAATDSSICQFVATPFGSGHSVESQITGSDVTGGIQFEITPYTPPSDFGQLSIRPKLPKGQHEIYVQSLGGRIHTLLSNLDDTIRLTKYRITEKERDLQPDQQRLIYEGRQLEDEKTLSDYNIGPGSRIYLVLRLRGGGGGPIHELSIAAGGKIHQTIFSDPYGDAWMPEHTTVFNVHILNSAGYEEVTGSPPPGKPIDAKTYRRERLPFFKLYEKPSGIHGNFSTVKSVAELTGIREEQVTPKQIDINPSSTRAVPVGLINPHGPLREFRSIRGLENEISNLHISDF